jgi:hypothetical protein
MVCESLDTFPTQLEGGKPHKKTFVKGMDLTIKCPHLDLGFFVSMTLCICKQLCRSTIYSLVVSTAAGRASHVQALHLTYPQYFVLKEYTESLCHGQEQFVRLRVSQQKTNQFLFLFIYFLGDFHRVLFTIRGK